MAYIPKPPNPEWFYVPARPTYTPAIVVHALKENRKPIGFAPWPDEPAAPKPSKKRKKKDLA